jgi:uncharacterized protein YjbI with pentapeptide repeats
MSDRSGHNGGFAGGAAERPGLAEVNPFSLIEAVNATSELAHANWLIYLGAIAYFCVAVAGVSHKDLLLDSAVQLPVLQVNVDLIRFFLFAPIVLVFLHFGLLVQHVMLSRKILEFDAAVRQMEPDASRSHPIRHELHSYFFTQALAGPERPALFGGFLHAMFWLSIVSMPVLVILFIQIVFLPYHDVTTTWSHRLALVLDIVLIALMGVFLTTRARTFAEAVSKTLRAQPLNFLSTAALLFAILLFSFFVATIPDEWLDRTTRGFPGATIKHTETTDGRIESRRVFALTNWLFEGLTEQGTIVYVSPFRRNLSVTDQTLTGVAKGQASDAPVALRGRDLRYAELDRSSLRDADLTGADLTGARLIGADLRGARISCSDIDDALTDSKFRASNCARIVDANLSRADLAGADLRLVHASGASFENAKLAGIDLEYADMTGANFSGADLKGASIGGGAEAVGANFLGADLRGADLKGVKIEASDFYGANLTGARLVFAQAQGANFQGAKLMGTTLSAAKLEGADFTDAELAGADFGAAVLWRTKPSGQPHATLADFSLAVIRPAEAKELTSLGDQAQAIRLSSAKEKLARLIEAFKSADDDAAWKTSEDANAWGELKKGSVVAVAPQLRDQVMAYLGKLSCQADNSDGAAALGIIQRVLDFPQKSSAATLLARLQRPDCPATKHLPEAKMLELEAAAEQEQVRATVSQGDPGSATAEAAPAQ